ncbi:MAG: TIGR03663 family protein [Chloroflexi bacterium]|nr:TIGR03663 family protein [Chloroflexota bacterium]
MATTYDQYPQSSRSDALSRLWARTYTINWEVVAYIVILAIALITRFAGLGDRVMSHDESLHTYYSWRLYTEGDFQHTPLMHGPILFHATAFFYFLFGDNDYTARLYPAILGVMMVMFPILFRRWLGRTGALLASIMILISPLLLFHHRYIREDTPSIFATLVMVYCLFQYVDGPLKARRKPIWLYIFAGAMLWSLGSKESAFIYIAIFGLFLTLFWAIRLFQHLFRRPSKALYQFVTLAILLGCTVTLVMVAVLNISLAEFETLVERVGYVVQQTGVMLTGGVTPDSYRTFLSWTLLVAAGTLAVVLLTSWWASLKTRRFRPRDVVVILLLTLAAFIGLIVVEEISQEPTRQERTAELESVDPVTVDGINWLPIIATYPVALIVLAVLVYSRRVNWWRTLYRFRELDILLLMGSLVLPWLTAAVIKMAGADPTDYSSTGITRTAIALVPFMTISIAVGLTWHWRRWTAAAAVFYALYIFFFTTMFTNPQGLASGMIGSLGYWLKQQGVERGSQPQYYYTLIMMPIYEYLPLIGSFLAMLAGLTIFFRQRQRELPEAASDEASLAAAAAEPVIEREVLVNNPRALHRLSFVLFAAWWGLFNFLAYTMAGEKMPWLTTHITLPLIFVTAWYFGRVFQNIDWAVFFRRGWLYLLLLPFLFVAGFQTLAPFLVGKSPFAGLQQAQLTEFNQWLAMVFLILVIVFIIVQVMRHTGWMHFRRMFGVAAFVGLALLTARTAWAAAFINYDFANEFIVYAHAAPGIKLMMEQVEDVSRRTTDGLNINFAWGGNAWPVTWYFRDLKNARFFGDSPSPGAIGDAAAIYVSEDIRARIEPILEDRYYRFEYIRMWWPMQDYFNLNSTRVNNVLDFSGNNPISSELRRGLFDIWWSRDYQRYGEAVGSGYDLQTWPVSERLFLYIRKDIAAQVWNLGVGDGTVLNPLESTTVNQCTANWQQLYGDVSFGSTLDGQPMNHALDIAVSSDRVFVADEFNNRISVFDLDGGFLYYIDGVTGGGQPLLRPNGVAIAPDGTLYVADTWNYRIVQFTQDGQFIRGWGQMGTFGAFAETVPTDAFWGPRDVTVDDQGFVYVADTGNKRIRVYTATGEYVRDIGMAGSALGQIDEPSGVVTSADGRLFVADTWNRRVSVFNRDGTPITTYDVRGWYEDLGNRPYVAIDEFRHLLYVTDPDAGRVLVYDTDGNCLGSFGQPSDAPTDNSQFDVIGGIAVDAEGRVYVTDASASRVLRFAPFVLEPVAVQGNAAAVVEVTPEVSAETSLEVQSGGGSVIIGVEVTPEATAEATE